MKQWTQEAQGFFFCGEWEVFELWIIWFWIVPNIFPKIIWITLDTFIPYLSPKVSSFLSHLRSEPKGRLSISEVNLLFWGSCKAWFFFYLWRADQNGLWQMLWYGKLIKAGLVCYNEIRAWHLHVTGAKTLATHHFPCNIHLCSFL
jgi:hypothetical protein